MTTIHVFELLGTPNAILHPFGMQVYQAAKQVLETQEMVIIDLNGIKNATSAFFHASIGNLFRDLGSEFSVRVKVAGIEKRPDWQERINDSIELVKNPKRQTETQLEVAALFED